MIAVRILSRLSGNLERAEDGAGIMADEFQTGNDKHLMSLRIISTLLVRSSHSASPHIRRFAGLKPVIPTGSHLLEVVGSGRLDVSIRRALLTRKD